MSRIEELPDDFNQALDLGAFTAGHSVDDLGKSYAERSLVPYLLLDRLAKCQATAGYTYQLGLYSRPILSTL